MKLLNAIQRQIKKKDGKIKISREEVKAIYDEIIALRIAEGLPVNEDKEQFTLDIIDPIEGNKADIKYALLTMIDKYSYTVHDSESIKSNPDTSGWDASNVDNMESMFQGSAYTGKQL